MVPDGRERVVVMASELKNDELVTYRQVLQSLRARLRGDLDQMTDEALRRETTGGTGNLSNVPLHMADLGTDNYDQEFTLELIENEQGTLELINEALDRMEKGRFGHCVECGELITKPRLQAIPYARHCIHCARKLEGSE
jgi:RNA polymerase-binding transcription factor DksA